MSEEIWVAHANEHLGSGHGPHACPGANLARMGLEVLLRSVFRRMPALKLGVEMLQLVQDGQKSNMARGWRPVAWEAPQPSW